MQTQALVQPPFLALPNTLPRVLRDHLTGLSHPFSSPVMRKKPTSMAPNYPPTSHTFLDVRVSRTGPHDHTSSSSPQQHSISASNPSRPIPQPPLFHPRGPRPLSPSDSAPRPSTETQPSPHMSPSPPPQIRLMPLFPPPYSAPPHQTYFASSATSHPRNMHSLLDQRRMSEPAMYGNAASDYPTNAANLSNARHQHQHPYSYVPPQSYGSHSSPLRRPSIGGSSWREDHLPLHSHTSIELEEPLSPLNPTFSGGESPPPMGMSETMFASLHEDYGPSPPGTGTSTSSNAPATHQQDCTTGEPSSASNSKQYSFVSLPGNAVKKRPRRRYEEIERLYQCSWQGCDKSYGTLNHLNAHITMQKHGSKRSPNEFKELRKQWRKAKKEEAEAKALDAVRYGSHQIHHPSHHHTSPHPMSNAEYQTHNIYAHHAPRSVQPIDHLDDLHHSVTHQQDVYPSRSQRYGPFVSPPQQHSGIAYSHPHPHSAPISNIPINRLPTSATLLTPPPGYVPSSMGGVPGFDVYEPYRSNSRPRTSHRSPDRGQPPSEHVNLSTGRNRDGP